GANEPEMPGHRCFLFALFASFAGKKSMETSADNLISIQDLKVHYRTGGGLFRGSKLVKAVDGVSLDIKKGETLGLVGESGCGKSTLGRAILRLTEPTGGKVLYNSQDLAHLPRSAMREQRKHLQMIF